MRRIRLRLSFSNVIAAVALFFALGGATAVVAAHSSSTGTIVGYARVQANGHVIATQSLNVSPSNLSLEASAAYCFSHLNFSFKGAQVTIDFAGTASPSTAQAQFAKGNPFSDCSGSGVQAEVVTSNGTNYAHEPFFVVFYK